MPSEKKYSKFYILSLIMFQSFAQAQIYECKIDGRTVYQQTECPGQVTIPPIAKRRLVNEDGYAVGKNRREREENRIEYLKSLLAKNDPSTNGQPAEIIAAMNREVVPGMPEHLVKLAWGKPNRVTKTSTASGSREQWVFDKTIVAYPERGWAYVHLSKGIVTSVTL